MRKGERMESFVKYEKEIESQYRRRLEDVKRPDEVGKVFVEFAFKFTKMVKDVPDHLSEEIKFTPENDGDPFRIGGRLMKELGVEIVEKSDYLSILKRMAESAKNRYKKLKSDDERTDLFRMGEGTKPH